MGASYWARWTSAGHMADLPNQLLPHVLAEGYDLLAFEQSKQVFDRGGIMKKLAWSLNGGHWSDAPVDLSISYSHTATKTIADFHWSLTVRPFPVTQKEQASFEAWIRMQLDRMLAGLNESVGADWTEEPSQEGVSLQDTPSHPHVPASLANQLVGADVAVLSRPARQRTSVQYASTYIEQPPHCDRCWKPAVAIPGTTGRFYCLTCHRHLPWRTAMQRR